MNAALTKARSLSPKYHDHADFLVKNYWIKYFKLGNEMFANNMFTQAADYYTLSTQIDSSAAEGLQRYGDALFKIARYKEAGKVYSSALKITPDNVTIKNNLAEIYFIRKQYQESIRYCNEILSNNENDYGTLIRRAYAHDALGNFKEAEADFFMAALVKPSSRLLSDFGLVYFKNNDYRKAIFRFEEALEFPDSTTFIYRHLGEANWRIRDYRGMVKWYQKIVATQPGDLVGWKNLAVAYEALGQTNNLAEARFHITKLTSTN